VLNETDLCESLVLTVGASAAVNVQFSGASQPKVSWQPTARRLAAFAWSRPETYRRWLSTGHVGPTQETTLLYSAATTFLTLL